MSTKSKVRRLLLNWYQKYRRDLPWRQDKDPYRVWVSEIMLQQTRVAAVIPYYERFMRRFPDVAALAQAAEPDVLAGWSGLGYYSRARNLWRAAREIQFRGSFPNDYESLRKLAGVGDYTAGAIASIAFSQPCIALDGNVIRVMARLTGDGGDPGEARVRKRIRTAAEALLDRKDPGAFNQALMELGATVCLPAAPRCSGCPIQGYCEAHRKGLEAAIPLKSRKQPPVAVEREVLLVESSRGILLRQRDHEERRMAEFWDLPEARHLPSAVPGQKIGEFRHSITVHRYRVSVRSATLRNAPPGMEWVAPGDLHNRPLTTIARKALRLLEKQPAAGRKSRPRN